MWINPVRGKVLWSLRIEGVWSTLWITPTIWSWTEGDSKLKKKGEEEEETPDQDRDQDHGPALGLVLGRVLDREASPGLEVGPQGPGQEGTGMIPGENYWNLDRLKANNTWNMDSYWIGPRVDPVPDLVQLTRINNGLFLKRRINCMEEDQRSSRPMKKEKRKVLEEMIVPAYF